MITRQILITILVVCSLWAQTPVDPTAVFPNAIVTDSQLMNVVNSCQTTLANPIQAADTTMTLVSPPACFVANMLVTIDQEVIFISQVSPSIVMTRGWDGTTAAIHAQYSIVAGSYLNNGYFVAWQHNAMKSEIEAIEKSLLGTISFNLVASSLTVVDPFAGAGLGYGFTFSPVAGNSGPNLQETTPNYPSSLKIYPNGTSTTSNLVLLNCGNENVGTACGASRWRVSGTTMNFQSQILNAGTGIITQNFGEDSTASALTGINWQFHGVTKSSLSSAGLLTTQTLNLAAVPTSAGGGGLYLCVDTSGNTYKKSSCP